MDVSLEEALTRFVNAKPDPVFVAAFETLKTGAPGLSEKTCEVLARSIAIKVAYRNAEPIHRRDGDEG